MYPLKKEQLVSFFSARKLIKGFTALVVVVPLALALAPAAQAKVEKTDFCHKPGTRAQRIVRVGPDEVQKHLNHGDHVVADETCNNVDDDCDGTVDGFATACGVGECADAGVCTTGVDSCTPGTPTAEQCDNLDNDCDGTVDGFATACGVGECADVGVCTTGVDSCTPGTPSVEVCDGEDDNCDGTADDGNPGGGAACDTTLDGLCADGLTDCQAGTLACVQQVFPSNETCDGADNDCDGAVDEGFAELNDPCMVGLGVCEASGNVIDCVGGQVVCDASPLAPTETFEETCTGGLDEDCDGLADGADPSCVTCPCWSLASLEGNARIITEDCDTKEDDGVQAPSCQIFGPNPDHRLVCADGDEALRLRSEIPGLCFCGDEERGNTTCDAGSFTPCASLECQACGEQLLRSQLWACNCGETGFAMCEL